MKRLLLCRIDIFAYKNCAYVQIGKIESGNIDRKTSLW